MWAGVGLDLEANLDALEAQLLHEKHWHRGPHLPGHRRGRKGWDLDVAIRNRHPLDVDHPLEEGPGADLQVQLAEP